MTYLDELRCHSTILKLCYKPLTVWTKQTGCSSAWRFNCPHLDCNSPESVPSFFPLNVTHVHEEGESGPQRMACRPTQPGLSCREAHGKFTHIRNLQLKIAKGKYM